MRGEALPFAGYASLQPENSFPITTGLPPKNGKSPGPCLGQPEVHSFRRLKKEGGTITMAFPRCVTSKISAYHIPQLPFPNYHFDGGPILYSKLLVSSNCWNRIKSVRERQNTDNHHGSIAYRFEPGRYQNDPLSGTAVRFVRASPKQNRVGQGLRRNVRFILPEMAQGRALRHFLCFWDFQKNRHQRAPRQDGSQQDNQSIKENTSLGFFPNHFSTASIT